MVLDRAARRNLELLESNDPFYPDRSLFSILDYTLTPMGSRKLKRWILNPLKNLGKINERLDGVEELYNRKSELKKLENLEVMTSTIFEKLTRRYSNKDGEELVESLNKF